MHLGIREARNGVIGLHHMVWGHRKNVVSLVRQKSHIVNLLLTVLGVPCFLIPLISHYYSSTLLFVWKLLASSQGRGRGTLCSYLALVTPAPRLVRL